LATFAEHLSDLGSLLAGTEWRPPHESRKDQRKLQRTPLTLALHQSSHMKPTAPPSKSAVAGSAQFISSRLSC
jgi:hypothetical protein